ncbi:MAG: Spy/CpxP family protein refolding chaperone [Xanthobacteraceae bacterium]
MRKSAVAVAAVLAMVATSTAFAAQPAAGDNAAQRPEATQRWRPSAEDLGAILDGRIAELKTALKLNADQEKNWPAFEQAVRDDAKARRDRIAAARDRIAAARDRPRPGDPIDRMHRRADAMTAAAAGLERLAAAAGPLYQSLDDGQQRRFAHLIRTLGPHRVAFRGPQHDHRGPGR